MNYKNRALRVLVVDDEALIANTLALIIEGSGNKAKAVYSAEEAIACLADFHPDVILSDVVMVGKTGIDLALYANAHHPGCKVLLISGATATADLLNSQLAAGIEFPILAKPVPPKEILAFLDACKTEAPDTTAAPFEPAILPAPPDTLN